MVTVREKTTVTQRIHGNCPTHSRTEISVRDVRTVIDEPKERDGPEAGRARLSARRRETREIPNEVHIGFATAPDEAQAMTTAGRRQRMQPH